VYGESIINDAVAIVIYKACVVFISEEVNSETIRVHVMEKFLVIAIGSLFFGVAFSIGCTLLLKYAPMEHSPNAEALVIMLFAYSNYAVCEALELSGIVASVVAGICMNHFTSHNLSPIGKQTTTVVLRCFALLAETLIFLQVGINVAIYEDDFNMSLCVVTIGVIVLARACNIFPIALFVNVTTASHKKSNEARRQSSMNKRISQNAAAAPPPPVGQANNPGGADVGKRGSLLKFRNRKNGGGLEMAIPWNYQISMWHAGLRGAIAYALAVEFPSQNQGLVVTTTSFVCLFTVFVFGGTTTKLLDVLGIESGVQDSRENRARAVQNAMSRSWFKRKWVAFAKDYMMPCLLKPATAAALASPSSDDSGDGTTVGSAHGSFEPAGSSHGAVKNPVGAESSIFSLHKRNTTGPDASGQSLELSEI
jgi:NhaP-type Na+/H+ or K+/H+ antiporter